MCHGTQQNLCRDTLNVCDVCRDTVMCVATHIIVCDVCREIRCVMCVGTQRTKD